LDAVREALVASLKTRFASIIDHESSNFNPKYVISTALDPMTAHAIVDFNVDHLTKLVKSMVCQYVHLII